MITYTQLLKSEYVKGGFPCTIRNVLRSKKTVSGCMSRTLVHLSDIFYTRSLHYFFARHWKTTYLFYDILLKHAIYFALSLSEMHLYKIINNQLKQLKQCIIIFLICKRCTFTERAIILAAMDEL